MFYGKTHILKNMIFIFIRKTTSQSCCIYQIYRYVNIVAAHINAVYVIVGETGPVPKNGFQFLAKTAVPS